MGLSFPQVSSVTVTRQRASGNPSLAIRVIGLPRHAATMNAAQLRVYFVWTAFYFAEIRNFVQPLPEFLG